METNLGRIELVRDIDPNGSSYPKHFIEFNDKLYFAASQNVTTELWATDGTDSGTNLVRDINFSSIYLAEFDNRLYFGADGDENGTELWVSDGTSNGTRLIRNINPATEGDSSYPYSSNPSGFTEFNNRLYFIANDGENGRELWVSDGTSEGTQLLKDINEPDNENSEENLEIPPGVVPDSSLPGFLIEFNNKLYFSATNDENGRELWVSDGTSEGTQLLKDINPGTESSTPSNFIILNDRLYFSADDGEMVKNYGLVMARMKEQS